MVRRRLAAWLIGALVLPLFGPLSAKAVDEPLTFNTTSLRPVELQAAAVILLRRLVFLLEQL